MIKLRENENAQHYQKKLFSKKKFVEKDSPTKGRPSVAADVVDILSNLLTKNYVFAYQVDVLRRTGEFWSNFEYAPNPLISKHVLNMKIC